MVKTNVEKVTDAMDFGSPLNQIVILTAIEKYCNEIANYKDQPDGWDKGCGYTIDWDAWKASALDIQRKVFHSE
tara:strand:+ start:1503 stop:1724 length:222 start_codon:yes stop_codon:yes gene_type:complete